MENYIGKKLKELRAKSGITQKELAKHLGCTEIMISRYELGVSQISIQQLEKIAKVFKTQIAAFFDGSTIGASVPHSFKNAFVFDLDDTLVDGRLFCGETIARVITNVNPSVNFDAVVQLHESIRGMTIEDLYIHILTELGIKADVKQLLKHDHSIQEENIDKMKLFDGVVDILEFLKRNNKKLYVCTNRSKDLMTKVFEASQILPYFDEVISCVDSGYKKPNPYCLIDLIKRSGMPANEFIYFGDSEIDSQFAQNAEIDHIIFDQYLNNKNLFKKLVNMFLENQINGEK
ncbi:HAD-IA family hydrolase [candidate division WWE3 bacterium]|nr:HAD-IA family hydrolase [candidate division WWE3 bacterium]